VDSVLNYKVDSLSTYEHFRVNSCERFQRDSLVRTVDSVLNFKVDSLFTYEHFRVNSCGRFQVKGDSLFRTVVITKV